MSNRFLVTQSAGNNSADACVMAYNYQGLTRANDGIIVVGGLNENDQIMPEDLSPTNYPGALSADLGSNYGNCIEAWAPASNLVGWSLKTSIVTGSSGTSYSAPIVAALASRYGGTQTRPIQREQYIMNNLQTIPGSNNGHNSPMRKAIYTPSPGPIPAKLSATPISASNGMANVNSLIDGKFYSDSYYYSPSVTSHHVVFDLGAVRDLRGVRITLRTSDIYNNPVHFFVNGSINNSSGNEYALSGSFTEPKQADLAPIYIPLSGNARYVLLWGNNPAAWLAYSEVEFYGY